MTECVLVAGGTGYIGGVVASQLVAPGYEIVVLVAHSGGYREAPLYLDDI
jgi:nucleoside-diphosphate-sugar epimerase